MSLPERERTKQSNQKVLRTAAERMEHPASECFPEVFLTTARGWKPELKIPPDVVPEKEKPVPSAAKPLPEVNRRRTADPQKRVQSANHRIRPDRAGRSKSARQRGSETAVSSSAFLLSADRSRKCFHVSPAPAWTDGHRGKCRPHSGFPHPESFRRDTCLTPEKFRRKR